MNNKTKILIVSASFYPEISDMLKKGATEYLVNSNVEYEIVEVPGAFEIPAAIAFAANSARYDGYVALGCVVRGETSHYDYVCSESANGLNQLAINQKLAIGYGILTVDNLGQARKRAGEKNKGKDAAHACLSMIDLKIFFDVKEKETA